MKLLHAACLATALMLSSCTILQGDTDTAQNAVQLIKITHADQQIALEALLGHPIDVDGDGVISAVEWDGAGLTAAFIYASGDQDKIEALRALASTPRFQVWAAAVAGDLALQRLKERLAEDDPGE